MGEKSELCGRLNPWLWQESEAALVNKRNIQCTLSIAIWRWNMNAFLDIYAQNEEHSFVLMCGVTASRIAFRDN